MPEPATVIDMTDRLPALPARVGPEAAAPPTPPRVGDRTTILAGLTLIGVFLVGFLAWAALAPLDSAAVAQGRISVEGNVKTVSHLEGGIARDILVTEGATVAAGAVLIRLDDTKARAALELVRGREIAALATEARLVAERDGQAEIAFPSRLLGELADAKVRQAIVGQASIFAARRGELEQQTAIFDKRVAVLQEEIAGLEGEIKAANRQLELLREELADQEELFGKGLARKSTVFALRRRTAEIEGARSRNTGAIARARQQIGETGLRIAELKAARTKEVVEEVRQVQSELNDLAERRAAAEDVLKRTEIVAATDGTVVGLKVHTPGGVIPAGGPLMDIVPSNDRLVVEARVDPSDIDAVQAGLDAEVRLTAFNARKTKPVAGKVVSVSADRLNDERSGAAYYLARIELTGDLREALDGAPLKPGMPAEVMIRTGSRTALGYLFKPISASLNRAFREK
jgi:HlyD family type I secretion membrane fusion protein